MYLLRIDLSERIYCGEHSHRSAINSGSRRLDTSFLALPDLLFANPTGGAAMSQFIAMLSEAEGMAEERELLRGETSPLRIATGFVLGSVLSGALWTAAGLLAWSLA
jgi:hypothetical protein